MAKINPSNLVSGCNTSDITDTTSTAIIAAKAGSATYITSLIVTNSHATVGTVVQILNGSTVVQRFYAKAVGGGAVLAFEDPLRGAVNTAWNCKCETTGSAIQCSMVGHYGVE